MHYQLAGKGTTVVLIHGFCETSSLWKEMAAELANHYEVIVPDLPGFGKSELLKSEFQLSDVADHVHDWLVALQKEKVVVIGHSLGGYVALELAKRHSEILQGLGLFHSTAFEDPEITIAMRYIKEHACDPISPQDVLKLTGMSNSTAYRKFMKSIGRSIHSEIQAVQMERVKELLTTTNLNITTVAQEAGFDNIRYLTKVFRDTTGHTPTEFRRLHSTPSVVA